MTPGHVKRTLDVLCSYYADRHAQPTALNAVQASVYRDGLAPFNEAELASAASQWMRQSQFFPKLSDLLVILKPRVDYQALAHQAWAIVEQAIREGGIYRGVTFRQGAIGECVRQVFGTWAVACSFELDSPGWAIRRQSFLAVFPQIAGRDYGAVTLGGLHRTDDKYIADTLPELPAPKRLEAGEPIGHLESAALLKEIRDRARAAKRVHPALVSRLPSGDRE